MGMRSVTDAYLDNLLTTLICCVGGSFISVCPSNSLGIASILKRCASAKNPCMVAGWVWVDGCQLVDSRWHAVCVGWYVGGLVSP